MDATYFAQAQKVIMDVLNRVRPELMEAYGTIEYVTKDDQTVVTALDKSIEIELRDALMKFDARVGLLGEEHGQAGNTETYWLLDPIDGTEHFIRGLPGCKNLICLMDKGKPVWGLTYFFAKDELWIAQAGKGVTLNGSKVEMHWRPLERCWLEMSVDLFEQEHVEMLRALRARIAGFSIRMGFDAIASGKVDGMFNLRAGGGPWDYWPRYLMLTEAGAKMANIGKDDYDFEDKNFLVAHAKNVDALMDIATK